MATNARLLVDSAGLNRLPGIGRWRHNLLRSLTIIHFLGISGCATTAPSSAKGDVVAELRAENARLEEKITQLQEVDLKSARVKEGACSPEKSSPSTEEAGENWDQPAQASDEHTEALPIVRLSPNSRSESEIDPHEFEPGPLAEPGVDDDTSDTGSTRPVLQVSGAHEARVYHRPIEAGEEQLASVKPD